MEEDEIRKQKAREEILRNKEEQKKWLEEQMRQLAEKKLEEEAEQAKIEKYAASKEALSKLRKQKEQERFYQAQATRQKIIDAATENLVNLAIANEERVVKQIEEEQEKKAKIEEIKRLEKKKLLQECMEYRDIKLKKNAEAHALDKLMEEENLNIQNEKLAKIDRIEEQKRLKRRSDAIQNQKFLRKQIVERRRRLALQKAEKEAYCAGLRKQFKLDDEEFQAYLEKQEELYRKDA